MQAVLFLKGGETVATTRIMPLHTGKDRTTSRAIQETIDYASNPKKTEKGELITGYACDPRTADAEFMLAKREYLERTGRYRGKDDIIAYHVRQSFLPGEITPQEANRLGYELAMRFTHGNQAFIVATHTDKKHIHNHIIFNAVTLECDRKFRNFIGSAKAVRRLNDLICIENGYSIVEEPKGHGKSYNKWRGNRAPVPHREEIRQLIDAALEKKPRDLDELLALLIASGCDVKRGKTISIRGPGQQKFKRIDTLGEDYSIDVLNAVLSGSRKHTPRRRAVVKEDLVLEIKIIAQNPSIWSKVMTAKEVANTINYLEDNNLFQYDLLRTAVDDQVNQIHQLNEKVKAAEARLSAIAVLRKHILNYIKTRDVYTAYRKSGYSKKFLAEHEGDILLHKAAKKAFDELGVKKLPTSKMLQIEYSTILEQKKKDYAKMQQLRRNLNQIALVQRRVDLLRELAAQQQEQQRPDRSAQR